MSVGLIRSETASDLRTLAATGASSSTRRTLTAATAGALGLLGAVLGTAVAYVAAIAYSWDNPLDGLSELSSVPTGNLLIILIGMPLIAAAAAGCSPDVNHPTWVTSRSRESAPAQLAQTPSGRRPVRSPDGQVRPRQVTGKGVPRWWAEGRRGRLGEYRNLVMQ